MYPTKNDLPEATRRRMIELCNARLADAIDLQTQTKQAHWNVKGPQFIALHELFEKVNEDVEDYVDLLAERAVQLGGAADRDFERCGQMALDGRGAPATRGMNVERDDRDRAERAIDAALAESFPASDAPPWTTGLDPHSVYVADQSPPAGRPQRSPGTRRQ